MRLKIGDNLLRMRNNRMEILMGGVREKIKTNTFSFIKF